MPTSTRHQNEDTEMFAPEEDAMFERRDFDRPGIRRELAAVQPITLDTFYVEREDKEFVDPRSMDMPFGPTGMGETGGSGVETVRIDGEEWKTVRYVHGFEYMDEEDVTNVELSGVRHWRCSTSLRMQTSSRGLRTTARVSRFVRA